MDNQMENKCEAGFIGIVTNISVPGSSYNLRTGYSTSYRFRRKLPIF